VGGECKNEKETREGIEGVFDNFERGAACCVEEGESHSTEETKQRYADKKIWGKKHLGGVL